MDELDAPHFDVFISHSSDDELIARRYATALKDAGISYWIDVEHIPPGASYPAAIIKGIKQSEMLLLLYSSHVQKRPEDVLNELEQAKKQNKMRIAVLLDGTRYTEDFEYYLGRYQWIDTLAHDADDAIKLLIERIRGRWLDRGGDENPPEQRPENDQSGLPSDLPPICEAGEPLEGCNAFEGDVGLPVRSHRMMRMILGAVLISCFVVAGGLLSWDASRTVQRFYADYVDSFGLPEGIFPLKKSELQRRQCHYRFEYHGVQFGKSPHADSAGWNIWKLLGGRRRLVRVVQADSRGHPFLWSLAEDQPASLYADRPSAQDFLYDRDARLREIKYIGYLDTSGVSPQDMRIELSNAPADDGTVTTNGLLQFFIGEGRLVQAYKRAESTSYAVGNASSQRSSIVQNRLFRDERGRVFRCYFLDARGFNIPEGDGLYGYEYAAYDDYGRPQVKWYLVRQDGGTYGRGTNKIGVAGEKIIYSGRNLFQMKFVDATECPVRGPYGWKVRENRFDEHGNVCSVLYENENGSMDCLTEGYAGYNASYDESGRMVKLSYFDVDLSPTLSDNGFSRIGIGYDAAGNIRELSYFDCDGKPVFHKEGYAARVLDVDTDGTLTRETCLGTNGYPIAHQDGYASRSIVYGTTEEGMDCKLESYFDAYGRLTVNVHGVAKCMREYDKRGNEVKVSYYGTNGMAAINKEGHAGWVAVFDDQGNEIERRFLGLEGQFVLTDSGIAGWNTAFNDRGLLESQVMVGTDGNPTLDKKGVAEYRYDYDARGNVVSCSHLDVNGEPTLNIEGIARWTAGYDQSGNMKEQWFFGVDGNLTLREDGSAGWQAVYDDRRNKIEEGYFDIDTKLVLIKDGYAWWSAEHDLHGNVVKISYHGIDGTLAFDNYGVAVYINQYDARDNLTWQAYFGTDGKRTLNIDEIAGWSAKYDPCGNMTAQWFWGKDGKMTVRRDGCASLIAEYDAWGNKTSEWYFDLEGKPALIKDGYASWRANHDCHGNATTVSHFGVDGKLALDKDGVAACCYKYDELNNPIRCRYYGADQRPITNRFGIAESRNMYDGRGNQTSSRFFGVDGKPTLNVDGVAGWDAEHDAHGHEIRSWSVGLDGNPIVDKYGVVEWKTEFDRFGNITNRTYLGRDGKPLCWSQIVETVDVTAGLPGSKNGMRTGDIWCRFGAYDILKSPNMFLVSRQRALVNNEKDLVVARKVGDCYEIHAAHFPVGIMGVTDDIGKTADYEKVVSAYREYCLKEQNRSN